MDWWWCGLITTTLPQSPGWWLKKLLDELDERRPGFDLLNDYFEGNPPLPAGPENCSAAFRQFQKRARANWAELIVEAPRERMEVVGFRTGADDDELGDSEAWRIWQANQLDADSSLILRSSLSMGDAYAIVGPVDKEIGAPLITPEDPREVIAAYSPVNRRKPVAAAKVFIDEWTGKKHAYLYLPGKVWRAEVAQDAGIEAGNWIGEPQELGAPIVPVVRFPNRQNLRGTVFGEFEKVTDDLDRINTMLLQRLVIAVLQAFRQRAAKNAPMVDEDGNDIDWSGVFRADPGAMWALPEGVDLWESAGVDLTPILESVKADVRDLAATTRTPMFYLFPDSAGGSAEGASLQREGLVFKTKDRIKQASEPFEQMMSLAFLFAGDKERAARGDMETLWSPPERYSLSERFDAASKAQAAGMTWEATMSEVLQLSPQQIERMRTERAADALLFGLTEPEPQTTELAADAG